MDDPILMIEEREAINSGRWLSSLSPSLRHDILRCAHVKRVNQELKAMEREQAIQIEPGGLVIRNRQVLMRIYELDH